MNKNSFTDFLTVDRVILYLLGVIFLMTFSHFIFTGFTSCDDYSFYCRYFNDKAIWENSYKIAAEHGRFYFTLMMPTFSIYGPFLFGSYLASRILTLIFIVAGVFVFAKTLNAFIKNASLSYLFLLIYVVFVCIKTRNSPLTGYPVYFSFSWFLLQCSFYYYLKYIQLNVKKHLLLSVLLYGCAMMFYEMYLLFVVVFFILHIYFKYDQSKPLAYLRETLLVNYPFLILIFCYCTVYLIFKLKFTTGLYNGVTVSEDSSLLSPLNALWQLTVGAFPLRLYTSSAGYANNSYILGGHVHGILNPLLNIKFEWLLKSVFIGTVFLLIIRKLDLRPVLKPFQLKVAFLLLILILFLPNVLLSVTQKYQGVAKDGMYYYLTTYFASFGVYTIIAILIYYLLSHHNTLIKKLSKWVFLVVLMWASVLNDYANHHAEVDLNRIYRLFDHVDGFLKSSAVSKFNTDSSEILSPELYSYHSYLSYYNECGFDWSKYFKAKTGKVLHVVETTDSITANKKNDTYRLGYAQFIDGHVFVLSSFKNDSIRNRTLYIKSTKEVTLVNYLIQGSIKTEKIDLPEKSQYNVIEVRHELLKSDSIWVSDIVY